MLDSKTYYITKNNFGRNILVVNQFINIDGSDEIKRDDFDIIFVDIADFSFNEISLFLQKSSPFYSSKCFMKPRFIKTPKKDILSHLKYLIDGYGNTPLDEAITSKAEEIYKQIARYNIRQMIYGINTYTAFFIRLCKYCISRNILSFTTTTIPSLTEGYTNIYTALLINHETENKNELITFYQKLIELKYIQRKRFVERTHLCPKCLSNYLIFAECCPKCTSSNIKEEPMLHHFRCANISPETTYLYDDQLRCPKCHQFLRHIGVDYDRPANVHLCHECGNTFIHSDMKVICGDCGRVHKPNELKPFDVIEYEFTIDGIHALTSNEAVITLNRDFWMGYTNFTSFLSQLRLFYHINTQEEKLYTLRFKVDEAALPTDSSKTSFLQDLHEIFYYFNTSHKGDYYFISSKYSEKTKQNKEYLEKDIEAKFEQLSKKYPHIEIEEKISFTINEKENIEKYIQRIRTFN